MSIKQLQSFRETIKTDYVKPNILELDKHREELSNSIMARDYLRLKRGLSDKTIKNFKLGYSEKRNAIVIPVFKQEELINLRYRHLDPDRKPKYTQKTGCEIWMYNDKGIDQAREEGRLIIVEGEFDLMSAWQAGFKAVISPASGKDSYGIWLELIDTIPRVYIAYDNDKAGKDSSLKLAERIGVDKCSEVYYSDDTKDANEYFQKYTAKDFITNIKNAKPYYKYQFSGVGDIITDLRDSKGITLKLDTVPFIDWNDVWVLVLSGDSGVGKTSYCLNIASELADKNIPTLILPFERGIKNVGKRFLQVRYGIRTDEFEFKTDQEWGDIQKDSLYLPLYFSMPSIEEFPEVVDKAKRFFDVQYCIIDHLDYFVKGSDKFSMQSDIIRQIESMAQELNMRFIVVHHINKGENGSFATKRPTKHMLSGSSDIYKVPEAVLMLYQREEDLLEVIIDKNKGEEGSRFFEFNKATGQVSMTARLPYKKTDSKEIDKVFSEF